jgi:hypothetical protein
VALTDSFRVSMMNTVAEFANIDYKFEIDITERQQPIQSAVARLSVDERRRYERSRFQ